MSELTLRVVVDFDDRIIDLLSSLSGGASSNGTGGKVAGTKKKPAAEPEPEPEEENTDEVTADSVKALATSIASQSDDLKAKVKAAIKKHGKADNLAGVKEANLAKLHEALTELKEEADL